MLLAPPSSLIKIIFFFSLFLPTYLSSDAEEYKACEPFSCGKFSNISYPFWSSGQQEYCGHPKFKLDCQKDNVTIEIMSQKFHVIDLNQTSKVLKIARLDLLADPCTNEYVDVNLDSDFFNNTSNDDDYTLLYDCGPVPYTSSFNFDDSIPFQCPKDGGLGDAYFVLSSDAVNFKVLLCKHSITVPVLKVAVKDATIVKKVLEEGFEVRWSGVDEEQCDGCIKSGGRCGHNASVNAFMCLCPNQQSYDVVCSKSLARSPKLAAPTPRATPAKALLPLPPNGPFDPKKSPHALSGKWSLRMKLIIGVIASASIAGVLICTAILCLKYKSSIWPGHFGLTSKSNQNIEAFLKSHGALSLKRYQLSEVKKMTNNLKVKLGQGGFGTVYKGNLSNGKSVAVKILNASKRNGEEFINEVASISRTSHINVVTLLGFCLEGRKRALIYEFMPNGSLDKFIYRKGPESTTPLSWEIMYQISMGIARGLEYLHKGCNTQILHFDIKPHNVLLDENFCPKIADFGLAKLCSRNESIISMSDARGTMGYVAPEMWSRHFGGISHKSDVYSYGMMLLEMVGGRKNINAEASHTSEIYFPYLVYRRLELDNDLRPDEVMTTEENEIAKRMTIVGLWCIQTFPNDRPTMSRVVDMLEGSMNSLEMHQNQCFLLLPDRQRNLPPQNNCIASGANLSSYTVKQITQLICFVLFNHPEKQMDFVC